MRNFKIPGFDIDKVPFVPALDLLEMEKNKLSDHEAALVAASLFMSLGGKKDISKGAWEINARKEALKQRI